VSEFDLSDMASTEPAEFARMVKATPDPRLAELMAGDQRTAILDEIFGRFPNLFRADRAGSMSAVIHWAISGSAGGGDDVYQVVIENGSCTTSPTADRDPRLTIALGPVEFLRVVAGAGNPMMMFMTGKLKAKGDLGLAANLTNLFDLPKG
jgi:hypothetical protein